MRLASLLTIAWTAHVYADFLGPRYPYPRDLSSNDSLVAASWKNYTSQIDSLLTSNNSIGTQLKNLTFSFGLFSTQDLDLATAAELQYHHIGPEVSQSPVGVKQVDGDSIYGVASITKAVTVYAALLNLKSADWNRPLTEIFPQLRNITAGDPISNVQWDKITVWSLAAQQSGIALNPWVLSELAATTLLGAITDPNVDPVTEINNFALAHGLPPVTSEEVLNAVTDLTPEFTIGANESLAYLSARQPRFLPWSNPAYSNNGFILLSPILQNLTGKPISSLFNDTLFAPLGMSNTSTIPPSNSSLSRYVILGESDLVNVQTDPGLAATSGGVRSTLHDLALFGTSVLNSTLLSRTQTRRWLKPLTHTDRLESSVGAPWEIIRYTHSLTTLVTDIYCKSGESGPYSSFLCLIPDFGVGFTMLSASNLVTATRSAVLGTAGNMLMDSYLPALTAQAAKEATANFAGTYRATGLNSTLTLALNETEGALPGLVITEFISNSTDVYGAETGLLARRRLQPTIEESQHRGKKIAFRMPADQSVPGGNMGLLATLPSSDWLISGAQAWNNRDLDLFVFDVNERGEATAVSPVGFGVTLEKL